jgi:hypothetical protein
MPGNFLDATLQAYTHTSADFVQPASGSNVVVRVDSTAWIPIGIGAYMQGGGGYTVVAKPSSTQVTLRNEGYGGNAAPTTTIAAGALLAPGGGSGGGGGGVTDHGALTGLGDDDHPQYLLIAGTRAMTGDLAMGSHKITGGATPTATTDFAIKSYVDSVASSAVVARLATAAALPANTRSGNVLTASANGALTVDSVAVVAGDVVLVKNEVTGANNGLYVVTTIGSGGAPFVLTRTTNTIVSGMLVVLLAGTANGGKIATLTTAGAITVNTTSLAFAVASGANGTNGTNGTNGAAGAAGTNGTNGTNGVDAFNIIPGANLTDANATIAPGTSAGFYFKLLAGVLTANRVLTMTGGTGLRAGDSVFIEVDDVSAFTYTMSNGGTVPATMVTKPISPGAKRIYCFQWDGSNFFFTNSTAIV